MKEVQHRSDCPIAYSLDFIGDKWVLLILRDLVFTNKTSYGEFLASEEKIATNILADRLTMLEKNGFITSTVSAEKKNKFDYLLTEKGIDLLPVISELLIWGSKYNPAGAPTILQQLARDKQGTIKTYRNKLLKRLKAKTIAGK